MTMDNGEGRTLDELESGQQDPQDWYFDLPSDAWRRQEEKNRLLRERVREREPERSERRDPWTLNKPVREEPKKRGLFGLGRRREKLPESENRPKAGDRGWMAGGTSEGDDWSTERVSVDELSETLRLKPRRQLDEPHPEGPAIAGERELPPVTSSEPPLRLRSRTEPPGESRLNWDFGPAGWPEPERDRPDAGLTDEPEDEASAFARMQAWAERGRHEQHRRLGLTDGRPDEDQAEAAAAGETRANGGPETPPEQPAVWPDGRSWERLITKDEGEGETERRDGGGLPPLRRRLSEESASAPEEGRSSKWDEFFGINREGTDDGGAGMSEGLAAMREWAKKKPLSDLHDLSEVPAEFLQPFEWEGQEQQAAEEPPVVAHELGEDDDAKPGYEPFAAFHVEPAAEEPAVAWHDRHDSAKVDQEAEPLGGFPVEPAAEPADDDPLAGIFPAAPRPATEGLPEPGKRSLFGRLFGRRQEALSEAAELGQHAPADSGWSFGDDTEQREELRDGSESLDGGRWEFDEPQGSAIADIQDIEVSWSSTPSPVAEFDSGAADDRAEERTTRTSISDSVAHAARGEGERRPRLEFAADQDDEDAWAPELPPAEVSAWQVSERSHRATAGDPDAAETAPSWEPEPPVLGTSSFGAAVQAALWSAEAGAEEMVEGAAASVEMPAAPAASEPDNEPRPWWEADEAEEAVEEGVASAGEPAAPAVSEPDNEPRPWWEADEAEEAVEEAVASVEMPAAPSVSEPDNEPRPWWEADEAEEAVDEAVASVEMPAAPAASEPDNEPRPWWEADEAEEAVASVEMPAAPAASEPDNEPRPWWEADEAEEAVDEAVASAEMPAAPAVSEPDREPRPWWETLNDEPTARDHEPQPVGMQASASENGGAAFDDDMWGAIAETAHQAATEEVDDIDLAASLEAQMDAVPDEPSWAQASPHDEDAYAFTSTEDEEDVILRAFEAHAASPEPEEDPAALAAREAETTAALEALFGEQGHRIVQEVGEEPDERPFIRLAAWAPQRRAAADDGWAPADEVAAELERQHSPLGFTLNPEVAPPWALEPVATEDREAAPRGDGRLKAWIREVVETVMLAALVFLAVRASFGNFKVDGESMYPTLENGQFLIVNKLIYSEVNLEKLSTFVPFIDAGDDPTRYVFHGPERGDIVVLRDPRDPSTDLIKRVIGLPGETIEIVSGKVYINDRLLEEPYITTPWNDSMPKILIPPDEYFVMGDNRNNSLDSRSAQVGLVSKDLIIGKATLSYLPLSRFGLAPNEKGVLTEQKPVLTTKRIGED